MPRSIDQIIEDTEAEEIAAVEKGEGGRVLAFARRIEARAARRIKKELVAAARRCFRTTKHRNFSSSSWNPHHLKK